MNYLTKLIKSLLPILIVFVVTYTLIFIFSLIYTGLGGNNLKTFINDYLPYIMIIFYIIVIIIIKKKYPNLSNPLSLSDSYLSLYLGVSLSTFLNMLIFLVIKIDTEVTVSLITSIISSAIIGPIFEEYIFRYYLFNKLKEFNNPTKAIIINSIIFAVVHASLINIIYAFILGLILNITYNYTNNIKSSILIHVGANLIAIFLTTFNITILILSLINLIICTILILKNNKNKIKHSLYI